MQSCNHSEHTHIRKKGTIKKYHLQTTLLDYCFDKNITDLVTSSSRSPQHIIILSNILYKCNVTQ